MMMIPSRPYMERQRGVRKVFRSYDDCALAWASESQDEGRAGGGRMFFHRGTIYSYGHHFPMGVIRHLGESGANAVFLNSDRYSVTTSRHQREVETAANRYFSEASKFYVPTHVLKDLADRGNSVLLGCTNLFRHALAESKELMEKSRRARSRKSEHVQGALRALRQCNRVAEFFGLKQPFALNAESAPEAMKFAFALLGDSDIAAEWMVNNVTEEML